jgi:phosphoribosylanthranilate isomerase
MEALVEAHNRAEVSRALSAGALVVGVNSRDLRTFTMDHHVVRDLRPLVPGDCIFVAESGITTRADAARARAWGADAILVGEALMREESPRALVAALASVRGGDTAELFAGRPKPFVKLCGLREPVHGAVAVAAGADAFGLIFAPARRQITPDQARAIIREARGTAPAPTAKCATLAVGVFVNEDERRLIEVAQSVGLDAVQLSGQESPDACAALASALNIPIIKAVWPSSVGDLSRLEEYVAAGATLLIEPAHLDGPGGQGLMGDWDLARQIAQRWPVLLAGGLHPGNVAAALASVHPQGVDVSSGIETHGVKDSAKLQAFVAAARSAPAPPPSVSEASS